MTTDSGAGAPTHGRRAPAVSPRLVIALALAVLVVVFVVQNRNTVSIELFSITTSAPLWLTLTVVALLGTVVGWLLGRRR